MKIKIEDIINFKWFNKLYLLYIFGGILNFLPANSFTYQHLLQDKYLTVIEINEQIFPVYIISIAVVLFVIVLFVDIFNYIPFLTICCLSGIIASSLMIWGDITESLVSQVFYGTTFSTKIAYFSIIYAIAADDRSNYQRLTLYIRSAPLIGKIVSSLLAHLAISQNWLNTKQLLIIDLTAFILSAFCCILLPTPKETTNSKKRSNFSTLKTNIKNSFPNRYVIRWTIWSGCTNCGFIYMQTYIQSLWVSKNQQAFYNNGAINGICGLVALFGTFLGGVSVFDWKFNGDLMLALTSLLHSFLFLLISQIDNEMLNYAFYIAFEFLYHFVMTMVCAEIAKFLQNGCFGIVVGGGALLGAVLNSILSLGVIMDFGFHLDIAMQFMVYGFYYLLISMVFIVVGLSHWLAKHSLPK